MIIVFCRSRELNGIREIKRAFTRLRGNRFCSIETIRELFFHVRKNRKVLEGIYCISDTDYIICVCIARLARVKVPIVLGVYHPKQWLVTLDEHYCRRRATVFRRLMSEIDGRNIIYSSIPSREACRRLAHLESPGAIVAGPVADPPGSKGAAPKPGPGLSIITVGRLVDFKLCTVCSMIDVVDALNRQGIDATYTIYGTGPMERELRAKTAMAEFSGKVRFMGKLDPDLYGEVVAGYTLFFGMGTALVHAAMLGVPSLIAIQYEETPATYGFLHEFDHREQPLFGDRTPGVPTRGIEEVLRKFHQLSDRERSLVGIQCRDAAKAYDGQSSVSRVLEVFSRATVVQHSKVTVFDLLVMRFETYMSRISNREGIQA